ncbi:MAG TPA: helix-turn-helix domain-containing protein [Streptosporangiaceae bacterium]|nr:helix-turn-helix domain-containing protein [Streptosporangiaceae bacterium]
MAVAQVTDLPVSEHLRHAFSAPLRPYASSCVGYRDAGVPPALHRGLPSPDITIIFSLDEPLMIAAHPDPAQRPGSFATLIGGLHTTPALISHDGWQSGIQVSLSPLGARALLGMPAGELAGIDVHGTDILGPAANRVRDRLQAMTGWPERFALVEQVLMERLRRADGEADLSGEVRHAWLQLMRSGGRIPVSRLAAQTGWSDRHLRTRFRTETGLGPKEAARVIRFDRARRQLMQRALAGQPPALADLAAEAGYFDQAHLNRDFALLAGCSPTTWLATEFRNFQAAAAAPLPE